MRLRLKYKHGQQTIDDVDKNMKVDSFLVLITGLIKESVVTIKSGFPPKPIDLQVDKTLEELGIKNGDNLIIETKPDPQLGVDSKSNDSHSKIAETPTEVTPTMGVKQNDDIPSVFIAELRKYLILRNVPDDNSCLFNSILYAIGYDSMTPQDLRNIVVNYIRSDPQTYNEAILGRSVEEYCNWILKKDSWGGAIELGILSDYFNIKILCLDIETNNFIIFEQEKSSQFIILVYSGIHYDLLVLNTQLSTNKIGDLTKWSLDNEKLLTQYSKQLCTLLQLRNYSTNTTTFRVRCLNCYKVLVGEMGASNHANETGHFQFGEVK